MALQGTLKDFGLAEILQLISMQYKTGVLTLENDQDTVKVYFEEGCVVSADTRQRNLEDLLGSVLIRGGLLDQKQLNRALRQQKRTLQRLGYLLLQLQMISPQDLGRALHQQVSQIVFKLFRWQDGQFQFTSLEAIDYDRDIFDPISAESLLMEGARMIDEWPLLERRIHSDSIIFNITAVGGDVLAGNLDGPLAMAVGSDISPSPAVEIDPDWVAMLQSINGVRSVREICDQSTLSEFDGYRGLCEFLSQSWIEIVQAPNVVSVSPRSSSLVTVVASMLVFLSFGAGLVTLSRNHLAPWRAAVIQEMASGLQDDADKLRLERIQSALRVYYLQTGSVPADLGELGRNSLLLPEALLDTNGRPYLFQADTGGYVLSRITGSGGIQSNLEIRKTFSAAQRAILEGSL